MSVAPPGAGREVRVRFAPSPTGWLHVGGARTAYFNWLFARRHAGAFVLRIEDTDVERSNAASETGVLDDLRWLDLGWDEGPDAGGPHGPYRQSERLALYREHADLLLSGGQAYPCFCTDQELEERRAAALMAGRPPQYDGTCRTLGPAEREARRREGRPESVRFVAPAREQVLNDLVRGEVRFPAGMVGDFVLLRSSGLPTYNFACVVDDWQMRISHVIRAEEHLSNTARQLMLYAAFAATPPGFAHVPLILNPDRTKMSKRGGEASVAVGDWRAQGYLPEALLSYLALLGFHPGDDREILSRAELLEAFTLERVGRSGSVFDAAKLRWTNAQTLHHLSPAEIVKRGAPWLTDRALGKGQQRLEQLVTALRGNLTTFADLKREMEPFVEQEVHFDPEAREIMKSDSARKLCGKLSKDIRALHLEGWGGDVFKSAVLAVGKELGLKGKDLFMPVRAALTGRTHGPELPVVAELLGGHECERRLTAAASMPERAE